MNWKFRKTKKGKISLYLRGLFHGIALSYVAYNIFEKKLLIKHKKKKIFVKYTDQTNTKLTNKA